MKETQIQRNHSLARVPHAPARLARDHHSRIEDQTRSIREATTDFYGTWNPSSGPIYLSDRCLEALGISCTSTADGQVPVQSIMRQSDWPAFVAQLDSHLAGETPSLNCDFRLRTQAGSYRWFQMRGRATRHNRQGTASQIVYSVRDIHAAKEHNIDLLASHALLRDIIESAPEVIAAIDPTDFSLVFFNKAFEDIVFKAHGVRIMPGMRLEDVAPQQASYWNNFCRQVLRDKHACLEYEVPGLNQTHQVLAHTMDHDGSIYGICIFGHDITNLKKAEAALHQLNGILISSQEEERRRIARELHDHIGQEAALLCMQAQRLHLGITSQSNTASADIHDLYRRLEALVRDISTLSHRLHSSELTFLGLAAAAERLCRDFARQCDLQMDCQITPLPPNMDSSKSLSIYRVLEESLRNIAKHSHATRVIVRLQTLDTQILLKVEDNGQGFDAEHTAAGLGLLSMRERLHFVGGKVTITSSPGYGTTVTAAVAA